MSETSEMVTHQKALQINLDKSIFGSFAEIGAGQEVARWFFRVGGASGTVAKTICAYDKEVSDELYGAGTRYVSRQRLEAMLKKEWEQLLAQVTDAREKSTRLFTFADTVATRNFAGTNDAHGWMGVRFQEKLGGEANELVLHVNMRDPSSVQQQEALGILGVNLLHALYHERGSAEEFLKALVAGLEKGRLEIDLIDFGGAAFGDWDRGVLLAMLVTEGMAEGVAFPSDGRALPPSEVVYKAPVVLAPGSFEHVAPVHGRILGAGVEELKRELAKRAGSGTDKPGAGPVGVFCLSAASRSVGGPAPSAAELTGRVAGLRHFGAPVLLTRFRENYHVVELVNRYTTEPMRFAVGESALFRIFAETYYKHLDGQILEGIARLFARNVKFYVYPMEAAAMQREIEALKRDGWEIEMEAKRVSADHSRPPLPLGHLYDYLLGSGFMVPMRAVEG